MKLRQAGRRVEEALKSGHHFRMMRRNFLCRFCSGVDTLINMVRRPRRKLRTLASGAATIRCEIA
jgi:hypothetical protein